MISTLYINNYTGVWPLEWVNTTLYVAIITLLLKRLACAKINDHAQTLSDQVCVVAVMVCGLIITFVAQLDLQTSGNAFASMNTQYNNIILLLHTLGIIYYVLNQLCTVIVKGRWKLSI